MASPEIYRHAPRDDEDRNRKSENGDAPFGVCLHLR
jgi:hypothetical protein